ncbi:MAG: hypothetical protein ACO2O4_04265 [Minisyncoccia bacterium]|jgi:hypothetical protein
MFKCDNLGNFGQKYVIRFGAWEGINFYSSEEKEIVNEFRPDYNRRYGDDYIVVEAIIRYDNEKIKKESIYNMKENIITSLYDIIKECNLIGNNLYYIAGLRKKTKRGGYLKALFKFPDELILGWCDEIHLHYEFINGVCKYLIYKTDKKYKLFYYPTREVLLKADFITPACDFDSYFYVNTKRNKIKFGIFHAAERKDIELPFMLFKIFKKDFMLVASKYTGSGEILRKYGIVLKYSFSDWKCTSCNKQWHLYIQPNDNFNHTYVVDYSSSEIFCLECDLEKLYVFSL